VIEKPVPEDLFYQERIQISELENKMLNEGNIIPTNYRDKIDYIQKILSEKINIYLQTDVEY
jgi:hypothetical protein